MARLNLSDAQAVVSGIIAANGGKMKYTALVTALNESGNGTVVPMLPTLKAQRLIVSTMEFESAEASRAVSYVVLPGGNA